jgi:hypothetical protein
MNIVRAVAIALLIPAAIHAQTPAANPSAEPYSFKDDRLGMSLEEFKKNHPDDGTWIIVAGDTKQHWQEFYKCKPIVPGIDHCQYGTTIASMPADSDDWFVDGKLTVISVKFDWSTTGYLAAIDAMDGKLGPATWSVIPGGQPIASVSLTDRAVVWNNDQYIARIEPHLCGSEAMYYPGNEGLGRADALLSDVTLMSQGHYCSGGLMPQVTMGTKSRVLFFDKNMSKEFSDRVAAAVGVAKKKSKGDI